LIANRFVPLGVLALNALWAFLIPTQTGKLLAAAGVMSAVLVMTSGRASRRINHPGCLAMFLLPGISLLHATRLAFWRLDGRGWLILAWLVYAIVLESESSAGSGKRASMHGMFDLPLGLFIFWTSVLWLTVVLDLGVGNIAMRANRTATGPCRVDWLSTMVSIWESNPASQHLFLAWRGVSAFADRIVYENHVHPYLLAMYGWIAAMRTFAGVPTYVASNSIAILITAFVTGALVVLLAQTGLVGRSRGATGCLALFVAIGFVMTTWRLWDDFYRFNTDNPYPLIAALFVVVYAFLLTPAMRGASVAVSMLLAALSPIHVPMLALAVACLFGRPGRTPREFIDNNQLILQICAWSTLVAVLVMAVPWTLVAWKGYQGQASTFLYRSGLDGDTSYFRNIALAVWSACPANCCGSPRPATNLLFPAFLPLGVFCWPISRSDESNRFGGLGRLTLFVATPYLVSLVFFAQSVSVHPYLYDHLLIVPAVIIGAALMTTDWVRSRLHGPGLLGFLLFGAALIMSNLIAIAQGLARLQ
jgi:hypothetical protein